MSRQNIARSTEQYLGPAYYARANDSKIGVRISPEVYYKDFGVIAASSSTGISASQSVGAAALFLINGALASGGVATFATPRNVVGAWTGTAIITIVGTDEWGSLMTEVSASGTSHTGKKAFKTVTSVTSSASITSATVGSGNVIGLPVRVDENGLIVANMDGAIDTTRVFVEADTTSPATGTTGDVRGTVDFGSDGNDTRKFAVLLKIASIATKVGAYGVLQFGSADSV